MDQSSLDTYLSKLGKNWKQKARIDRTLLGQREHKLDQRWRVFLFEHDLEDGKSQTFGTLGEMTQKLEQNRMMWAHGGNKSGNVLFHGRLNSGTDVNICIKYIVQQAWYFNA